MNYKGKDDYIKFLKKKNEALKIENEHWRKKYMSMWTAIRKAQEILDVRNIGKS